MANKALDIIMRVHGATEGEHEIHKLETGIEHAGREVKVLGEKAEHGSEEATRGFRAMAASIKGTALAATGLKEALEFGSIAGAVFFLLDQLKEIFTATVDDEDATQRLAASLRLAGDASAGAADEAKEFAEKIEGVTTASKHAVMEGMSQLASEGQLTGENLKAATVAAIGLSERLHIDLTTAFNVTSRAMQGHFDILGRYGITVDRTKTPLENMQHILEVGAQSFQLAEDRTNSLSGAWHRFTNQIESLREHLGAGLSGVTATVLNVLTRVIDFAETWSERIKEYIVTAFEISYEATKVALENIWNVFQPILLEIWKLTEAAGHAIEAGIVAAVEILDATVVQSYGVIKGWIAGAAEWITSTNTVGDAINKLKEWFLQWEIGVVAGLAVIEFTFKHWQEVLALAILKVEYNLAVVGNTVQYIFTDVIPTYLHWLARNWQNIFQDIYDNTVTVFKNLGLNIGHFFESINHFMQGKGWDFTWQPLVDGFKRTTEELPKILERQEGPMESILRQSVDGLSNQLSTGVGDLVSQRLNEVFGATVAKATEHGKRAGEAAGKGVADGLKNIKPDLDKLHLNINQQHKGQKESLAAALTEAHSLLTGVSKSHADVAQNTRQQIASNTHQQLQLSNQIQQNTAAMAQAKGGSEQQLITELLAALSQFLPAVTTIASEIQGFQRDRARLETISKEIAANTDPANPGMTDAASAL